MMPTSSLRLVIIGLFLWPCLVFSQAQIQLMSYLSELEEDHAVSFNYLNEDVKTLKITRPQTIQSLKLKLNAVSLQIPVDFEFLDVKNIVVKRLKNYYCLQFFTKEPDFFPLPDVYLSNEDKIIGKTYANGTLILSELPNTTSLKAYREGFEILEIQASKLKPTVCQSYFFEQKIDLDEVTLKGFLTRGLELNTNLSLTLNPQEFEILPGLTQADVLQSMQLLPGVLSLDERISNINVRGGTHDQNLFLWNGARLYQTGHFFGMISALNPSIAHQVNIYKNGSSAFYAEGLSSVVDISSTGNRNEDDTFEIFANFLETTASADVNLSEQTHIRVAGRYALSNILDTPTFQNYFDKIFQNTEITSFSNNEEIALSTDVELQYYDASLQFETAIDDSADWQFNLLGISNDLDFSEEKLSTGEQQSNQLTQQSFVASTKIDKQFSKRLSGSATAYASYYNLDAQNALLQTNQQLDQNNEVQDYGIKLRSDFVAEKPYRISLGYQFNEIGIRNNNIVTNPDVVTRQKSVLQTHSGIMELESRNFKDKLISTAGLRMNYYDKYTELRFEPHLNLTYQWNPFFRTALLAEQKHQVTAQVIDLQNDFFGVENRRWVLADGAQIPIQRLRQFEIGQVFNKRSWLITANVFFKSVEDISSSAQNFVNQLEFLQISGNYETYGAEFFLQKMVADFRFWINYAYNISDYKFDGFTPAVFPNNFETSHHIQSGISYVSMPFKLSLSTRYFSGRPTTPIDSANPVLDPDIDPEINFLSPNSDQISDYTQVNFTGSYTRQFSGFQAEIGLSVLNVLNSGDITNQFFRLNNDVLEIERIESRSLSFTPNAFLRFRF
jgi:hypothetical protein